MKIRELLDGINKRDLVLPEFQREYVWSKEQAKQLFVSLAKDYPVGSLMIWKTDEPPELKNIKNLPTILGSFDVILDGQQRLTTLFMLIEGEIPPFYREVDIDTDPRELYYNIETGDFQYYQATRMKENPAWVKVTECFQNQDINVFEIAQQRAENEQTAFNLANKYNKNLNTLKNIQTIDFTVQNVPPHATLEDAIDIFDRVNSQGTKLTDAELALTHVTGKWAQARRVMKEKIDELEIQHFNFDLSFMTRALNAVVTGRALFEVLHTVQKEELKAGWDKLSRILDNIVAILPSSAFIHSTQDINTTNVLIPWIAFLARHNGKFPNERSTKNAIHWLYAAHTWARYTSQTDQRLEFDLSLVKSEDSPWDELRNQIIDQRGRIEVKSSDLEGRGIQHPLFRMALIIAKAQGAVDWFNGAPLWTTHKGIYSIHNHHIFPQSKLYAGPFDSENHLHRKIVNEIANRAVLTAETNLNISNMLPSEYFPQVQKNYPTALEKQFVPMNLELWKLEHYSGFLEARRQLMAKKINEFMDGLITEPEIPTVRGILELIGLGESATLEFKSTFQWDVVQNKLNKALRKQVLKTIAAFLNSSGGTLIVGVEDDGNIYGLEEDLATMKDSTDRFGNQIAMLTTDYIGAEFAGMIEIIFESVNEKLICKVIVSPAPIPAYLRGDRGSEFWIRFGPTSRMLDSEETVNYININWN
jgi:hypothetical protein